MRWYATEYMPLTHGVTIWRSYRSSGPFARVSRPLATARSAADTAAESAEGAGGDGSADADCPPVTTSIAARTARVVPAVNGLSFIEAP